MSRLVVGRLHAPERTSTDPEAWRDEAECQRTADPDRFFPENGLQYPDAQRMCESCPVRVECLAYALDERIGWGTWGGTTPTERKRMLRRAV